MCADQFHHALRFLLAVTGDPQEEPASGGFLKIGDGLLSRTLHHQRRTIPDLRIKLVYYLQHPRELGSLEA